MDVHGPIPTARVRGRRPKSLPDGRQALIKAAVLAFGKLGYDGADLRSIARAADVDPALVRVHFGSKAGLWDACLDEIVDAAKPMLDDAHCLRDSTLSLIERLRLFIERLGTFVISRPECRDFVTMQMSEVDERADVLAVRLVRPAFEAARPLIEAGIESGHIRVRHPALFYGLLHHALNRPRAAAVILNKLAPDIAPDNVDRLLVESLIEAFLDPAPASQGRDLSRSGAGTGRDPTRPNASLSP